MVPWMHLTELTSKRIAVWGFGREGRATLAWLRKRVGAAPLALFCAPGEVAAALAFAESLGGLTVHGTAPDDGMLAAFDIVVKSPGISAYHPELLAAQVRGTRFTSGTALWFANNPGARTVAITGTKGKSTTTALLAHLARSLGVRTALAGNIGVPLIELDGQTAELWAIELSSYQTTEASGVDLGVVTSLYEEHLDWHGTKERYLADKLRLADASAHLLVNALQPPLLERTEAHGHRHLFGVAEGWHVAGDWIRRGSEAIVPTSVMTAPGTHNALNACAALAVLELMGYDPRAAAPALASFEPLPHRLQPIGTRDGITYVNDSISTTPLATLAALETLADKPVAVIVGGHDRGLEWHGFVDAVKRSPPAAIICQGANGERIYGLLNAGGVDTRITLHDDLGHAFVDAQSVIGAGYVLLSPGAPSFDQFVDYADRGRHFAEMAGFDGKAISGMTGLGIA